MTSKWARAMHWLAGDVVRGPVTTNEQWWLAWRAERADRCWAQNHDKVINELHEMTEQQRLTINLLKIQNANLRGEKGLPPMDPEDTTNGPDDPDSPTRITRWL